MRPMKRPTLLLIIILTACAEPEFDGLGSDTGDELGDSPCAEQSCEPPARWDPNGFDCALFDCVQDFDDPDGEIVCSAVVQADGGHWLDFAISTPTTGDLSWNELPWDADAGAWEDADLIAPGGDSCGTIRFNAEAIAPDPNTPGERYVDLVCTDWTAGVFTTSRVYLTPYGPITQL